MSYDLSVWHSTKVLAKNEGGRIYIALCDGREPSEVEASPNVARFVGELTALFPPLENSPDISDEDCPWSCAFDITPASVVMNMVWGRSDDVPKAVAALAHKYGLYLYDPQEDVLWPPPRAELVAKPRWWLATLQRLYAVLHRPLF